MIETGVYLNAAFIRGNTVHCCIDAWNIKVKDGANSSQVFFNRCADIQYVQLYAW